MVKNLAHTPIKMVTVDIGILNSSPSVDVGLSSIFTALYELFPVFTFMNNYLWI